MSNFVVVVKSINDFDGVDLTECDMRAYANRAYEAFNKKMLESIFGPPYVDTKASVKRNRENLTPYKLKKAMRLLK